LLKGLLLAIGCFWSISTGRFWPIQVSCDRGILASCCLIDMTIFPRMRGILKNSKKLKFT